MVVVFGFVEHCKIVTNLGKLLTHVPLQLGR